MRWVFSMTTIEAERTKYRKMWEFPQYRKNAPGERLVDDCIARLKLKPCSLIDFGCGTGRAAKAFQDRGFDVFGIDIADNCLDPGVEIPLSICSLWESIIFRADAGFCTDVMEHIPTEHVDAVLSNIARSVKVCYFQIATFKDGMGALIGDTLHLTVKPAKWWEERLAQHFRSVDTERTNGGLIAVCKS